MVGLLTGPVPAVAAGASRGENLEPGASGATGSRRPRRGTIQRGRMVIDLGGEVRSLCRNGPQISGQRCDVFGGEMTKTEIDRFSHATSGAAVRGRVPGRQILFYFGVGPCAYAGLTVRSDVVGLPPVNDRSGVFPAALRREHQIAGGVAIAAVRERFGEIRSAIPCRVVGRRSRPLPGRHKPKLPGSQHVPLVEWESD